MGETHVLGARVFYAVFLSIPTNNTTERGFQRCAEEVRKPGELTVDVCEAVQCDTREDTWEGATRGGQYRTEGTKDDDVQANGEANEQDLHSKAPIQVSTAKLRKICGY